VLALKWIFIFGAKRKKMNDNRGQVNNSWEIENCDQKKKLRGKREKENINTGDENKGH
jgi:hypothetical protein